MKNQTTETEGRQPFPLPAIQPIKPLPYLALSKSELGTYPIIQTVDGRSLRVDMFGILYPGRKMIAPPPERQWIEENKELLRMCEPIQTPTISSYRLKHDFERIEKCGHLKNGGLIIAASEIGIRMLWIVDSLNVRLAISRRWHRAYTDLHP